MEETLIWLYAMVASSGPLIPFGLTALICYSKRQTVVFLICLGIQAAAYIPFFVTRDIDSLIIPLLTGITFFVSGILYAMFVACSGIVKKIKKKRTNCD